MLRLFLRLADLVTASKRRSKVSARQTQVDF